MIKSYVYLALSCNDKHPESTQIWIQAALKYNIDNYARIWKHQSSETDNAADVGWLSKP